MSASKSGIKNYTTKQLAYILKLDSQDVSLEQIVKRFNKRFDDQRSQWGIRKVIKRYQKDNLPKRESDLKSGGFDRDMVLKAFFKLMKEEHRVPTHSVFKQSTSISHHVIKSLFGSFNDLEAEARKMRPKLFNKVFDETNFTEEGLAELMKSIKSHQRFVITTAVTGCEPHEKGLAALQSYCKVNNAKLLIMPCSDPAKTRDSKYKFALHHKIPNDSVVFCEVPLNDNLILADIKLGAKQLQPLTGLKRLGHKGSCIFASPKQMLEHVPSSNKKGLPKALMTTGAITKSDYRTDMYLSERTAYLANTDHKLGAIIVEIKDERIFFYRRVEIDEETGSFHDLQKKYTRTGRVKRLPVHVLNQPDWHMLSVDEEFRAASKEITEAVKPQIMTFEDFFDGYSINPHEANNVLLKAKKHLLGDYTLEDELLACSNEIDDLCTWGDFQIYFKYGNHEDFLKRWLSNAAYATDFVNHYTGVCLAKASLEDNMPFEYAMRKMYPVTDGDRMTFLSVNDSLIINGIENAVHGHLGASGKRNPGLVGLEINGPCTTGHTHSAAILRDVVRVGTATKMQLVYNDGASAWTHTLNLQHQDGARQLITIIEGEWCLPDILE